MALGKQNLEKIISQAGQNLDAKNVMSHAFPDRKITEIVNPDFIMSLIVNEHMDHGQYLQAVKAGALPELVGKIWTIVGLNQEKAMKWSISSAGACCLTQFMPRTYTQVVKTYPEAQLDPKISSGRQEHTNAVEASILLFDSDISSWKEKTKLTCLSSTDMMEKCLAVSYNGGPGTLNSVIKKFGYAWESGPIKTNKWIIGLRLETATYIQKLVSIKNYLVATAKSL